VRGHALGRGFSGLPKIFASKEGSEEVKCFPERAATARPSASFPMSLLQLQSLVKYHRWFTSMSAVSQNLRKETAKKKEKWRMAANKPSV